MTPRERAGVLLDRWNLDTLTIGRKVVTANELITAIEQAIIAAVEEAQITGNAEDVAAVEQIEVWRAAGLMPVVWASAGGYHLTILQGERWFGGDGETLADAVREVKKAMNESEK